MQLTDLKIDDYYYAEYSDHTEFAIVKGTEGRRANLYVNSDENKNSFWKFNQSSAHKNIRLATEQEIHWLDCCIKQNTFISYNEAIETFVPFRTSNPEADKDLEPIYKRLLNVS